MYCVVLCCVVNVYILLKIEHEHGMQCMTFTDCKLHFGLNSVLVSLKITLGSLNITQASLNITQANLNSAKVSLFTVSSR